MLHQVRNLSKERTKQGSKGNDNGKRNRILIKITGWPRIRFLHEVFREAKFVHIIRDGRAVANSMINVRFWRGWMGPCRWRELDKTYKEEWARYDYSFIALAAIQWKIYMDAVGKAKKLFPRNSYLKSNMKPFARILKKL